MLVREDGSISGTIGGGCVEAEVWAAAKEVIQNEQPRKMTFNLNHDAAYDAGLICGGTLEIFVEPILPSPTLYLFGGGHVSTAVARVAAPAGFIVGIIDDREAFANKERFPMASELYTSYEEAFEKIHPNASSYLVIVTRGHKDDMRVLAWAVEHRGPLHRHDRQQAQSDFRVQGARKGRILTREIRARLCSRGPGDRCAHAGRNRREHHRRIDRRSPQRAAAHCRTSP